MIQADLNCKTAVPEDVLTSSCIGLLLLLPDRYFIELLGLARHLDGRRFDVSEISKIALFEFWPWIHDGGVPDAIATLSSSSISCQMKIVIEVKHGAGKSGGDDDQLVRYLNAAIKQYDKFDVSLLYLTHHRDIPVVEIDASLSLLSEKSKLYWASWYTVANWAAEKIHQPGLPTTESRILSTLSEYLAIKGYKRFQHLNFQPSCTIQLQPLYVRSYFSRISPVKCTVRLYQRMYFSLLKPSAIPQLYCQGGL